jgi:DNA-binding MarR family transcriptional regulator
MSHKASHWAFERSPATHTQKLVLILLADWADETGLAWPKQSTLADKARLSIRHLRRVLDELEAEGYLRRVQTRRRDGRRGVDNYQLDLKDYKLSRK